jgi:diacylglycerol O-acyltransferase
LAVPWTSPLGRPIDTRRTNRIRQRRRTLIGSEGVITVRQVTGGAPAQPRAVIERTSPADLMQLASDLPGSPVQVAAVLVLGAAAALDITAVRDAIGARIQAVPRLRQRLIRAPFGCGRPVWVDDPDFDIRHHISVVRCPAPGDEMALLSVAADTAIGKLPANRPLWSATLVTSLSDDRAALILVLHHVLADGIGGLAVLACLVDGTPTAPGTDFPRPSPGHRVLFRDAFGTRMRALAHARAGVRQLGTAVTALAEGGIVRPPRSSLNQPTGPRRSLAVARVDLASVRRAAHAHGATVNDVVLTAVTGALHAVLRHRGESVDRFVISVPISARRGAAATRLGNWVGVMPVPVTATVDPHQRLRAIAHTTRDRRPASPTASAAVLGPMFRTLAWLRVPMVRRPATPGHHLGRQPTRPRRSPVIPGSADHRAHSSVADHRQRDGRVRRAVLRRHARGHRHRRFAALP